MTLSAWPIPYVMADVAAVPRNGLVVASTFSGCGGSSLGYKLAGCEVRYANEFVPAAGDTYAANHPTTHLDRRDIREVKPEEILAACGVAEGELDILDGSPPCASFSMSGKRERDWGKARKYSDKFQRVDDLFFEFVRILRGVRPRAFVAENVEGLTRGTAKGVFLEIMSAFSESGYRVAARVLDAQWLGVPQTRKRLIFVGIREDLGREPRHPLPFGSRVAIADVLPWIATTGAVPPEFVDETDEGAFLRPSVRGEWEGLAVGEQSSRYFNLIKADPRLPSPTILALTGSTAAGVAHPYLPRKFAVAEVRRICGFPDDFVLTGKFEQRCERLGRAVPPPMMRAVALAVADVLAGRA